MLNDPNYHHYSSALVCVIRINIKNWRVYLDREFEHGMGSGGRGLQLVFGSGVADSGSTQRSA